MRLMKLENVFKTRKNEEIKTTNFQDVVLCCYRVVLVSYSSPDRTLALGTRLFRSAVK